MRISLEGSLGKSSQDVASFFRAICDPSLLTPNRFLSVFRYYMVLDEAQNIKNYQSQKWQALLHFNTQRRVLLTGTPLQNDLTELWSLMHFLMVRFSLPLECSVLHQRFHLYVLGMFPYSPPCFNHTPTGRKCFLIL